MNRTISFLKKRRIKSLLISVLIGVKNEFNGALSRLTATIKRFRALIFRQDELSLHAGQIARMYRFVLGRQPDQSGMADAMRALHAGVPLHQLISDAMASEEFARSGRAAPTSGVEADAWFHAAFGQAPPALDTACRSRPVAEYAALLLTEAEAQSPTRPTAAMYPQGFDPDDAVTYRRWLDDHHAPAVARCDQAPGAGCRPRQATLSLILPQSARWRRFMQATVRSVQAQTCHGFELIVVGDAEFCAAAVALHPTAIAIARDARAAGAALNAALAQCRGTFVLLLTPGMRLAPDAVFHIEAAQAGDAAMPPSAILVDHDLIDRRGRRHRPHFAAGWDAERALSAPDWTSCTMLRTQSTRTVGGARNDCAGHIWDDLALRVVTLDAPARVHHIPRPLFSLPAASWPAAWLTRGRHDRVRASTREPGGWVRIVTSHVTALAAAQATVAPRVSRQRSGAVRQVYPLPRQPPLVSIIIPTRDKPDLLRACLEGIVRRTGYRPVEILVVDHDSVDPRTAAWLREDGLAAPRRVLPFGGAFNWGEINNFAAGHARGAVLLLLNNDTEVIHPDWLTELVAQALRPEVGAVGAKLLYRNGTVQHAGLLFGPGAQAYHRFRHVRATAPGYGGALAMVREVSAVTGACLAMRQSVFHEVGGIEEAALAVTWSDADLCLRVRQRGYRVIWTPFARLLHLELATRGADDTPERAARAAEERRFMLSRWPQLAGEDKFYNPNLYLGEGDTRLAGSPRLDAGAR
jgi:GT2 family glycosyltransferase